MKKVLIAMCFIMVCGVAWAGNMTAPKDMIRMGMPGGKMAPVEFMHSSHANYNCTICHHKGNITEPCVMCHSDLKARRGDDSFYMAFHKRDSIHSCVGCHKIEKVGPTRCSDCHPKE